MKSQLTGKDPDAGKDRRRKEKKVAEDEMVGWHHQLNGHEFEQTPGDSEGQGSLACCSPWVGKKLDTDGIEHHHLLRNSVTEVVPAFKPLTQMNPLLFPLACGLQPFVSAGRVRSHLMCF